MMLHVPLTPRLQVADERPPVGLTLHDMVPVGVVEVPPAVSNTAAVHVVALLTPTGLGAQLMLSRVERVITDSVRLPELGR